MALIDKLDRLGQLLENPKVMLAIDEVLLIDRVVNGNKTEAQ